MPGAARTRGTVAEGGAQCARNNRDARARSHAERGPSGGWRSGAGRRQAIVGSWTQPLADGDDELAPHVARLEALVGVRQPLERVDVGDVRAQPAVPPRAGRARRGRSRSGARRRSGPRSPRAARARGPAIEHSRPPRRRSGERLLARVAAEEVGAQRRRRRRPARSRNALGDVGARGVVERVGAERPQEVVVALRGGSRSRARRARRASWTAKWPTPPAPPPTNSGSPPRRPSASSAWWAVRAVSGIAAASSKDSPARLVAPGRPPAPSRTPRRSRTGCGAGGSSRGPRRRA